MPLSKDDFLTKARRVVRVDVPELGEVCIRKLSLIELNKVQALGIEFEKKYKDSTALAKFLLAYALSDEDANRLFVGTPDPKAKPPVSQDEADYQEANKLVEKLEYETAIAVFNEINATCGFVKNTDGTPRTVEQEAKN